MKVVNQVAICLALTIFTQVTALEPNPPQWPSNVFVLKPNDENAQSIIDQIYNENGGWEPPFHGQWSDSRYALLFTPGYHNVTLDVGFYTQALGLGLSPNDTQIFEVVGNNGGHSISDGSLQNFWRSVENVSTKPPSGTMTWSVSQASPLRKVNIDGDLQLFQINPPNTSPGYGSGGYMSDCIVSGKVYSGNQQQWFYRNNDFQWGGDGAWNMVFLGCNGAPNSHCGSGNPYTTVPNTPIIAEKPYIVIDDDEKFNLVIPKLEQNKQGTSDYKNADLVDFSHVFVATVDDSVDLINEKINQGLHIVLTPGQYVLNDSIKVTQNNTVILGLGLATLICQDGNSCIEVGNVEGVKIGGILFQAGPKLSDSLLKWGTKGYFSTQPGFLYDCFARVGGPNNPHEQEVQTRVMVQINSSNIIIDNAWLWRADHDVTGLVFNSDNPVDSGLEVNGDKVKAYGLASEHTLKYLVHWKGNEGETYFYQSEMPYDVTQENYGDQNYCSYKVDDEVTSHKGWGIGVYSFFRDNEVVVQNGIQTPETDEVQFVNSFTLFLSGKGRINHVINGEGNTVPSSSQGSYVCSYPANEDEESSCRKVCSYLFQFNLDNI